MLVNSDLFSLPLVARFHFVPFESVLRQVMRALLVWMMHHLVLRYILFKSHMPAHCQSYSSSHLQSICLSLTTFITPYPSSCRRETDLPLKFIFFPTVANNNHSYFQPTNMFSKHKITHSLSILLSLYAVSLSYKQTLLRSL